MPGLLWSVALIRAGVQPVSSPLFLFCIKIIRVNNHQPASTKKIDETLTYLFDGQSHPLTAQMGAWLADSRRFTAFVNAFCDKIRKKLRVMQESERLNDLRLELETAYLLLQEPRLSVVYEPQLGGARCPDFEVSFTTSLTFMVEVTRLRIQTNSSSMVDRLADTMCDKLGQLLPQLANVLLIGIDAPPPTRIDLHAALMRVQQRAERNDATFLRQYGFRDRADFFRQFQRMSEILVRGSQLQADEPVVVLNLQAKNPLPAKARTVLYRSHTV